MKLREYKTFNYEFTVEEYEALEIAIKILTTLGDTFNSNVVYIHDNRINLKDIIFYLNILMKYDGKEVYKLNEENARE